MENGTSKCFSLLYSGVPLFVVGIAISVSVICVSLLIIVTIWKTPALHSNTNFFIASVAVSAMLLAVTFVVCAFTYYCGLGLHVRQWELFETFILGTIYSMNTSTALHLTIMAIDRYMCIFNPFYYIKHMTRKRTFTLILFTWSISLLNFTIALIFYRGKHFHTQCVFLHPPVEYFSILTTLGLISFGVASACYIRIARLAFERKRAMNSRRAQNYSSNNIIEANGKAAVKSIQFCVAMFGTIGVCYFPYLVIITMSLLSYNVSNYVFIPSLYLMHIHSLVEFAIYLKQNKDFCVGVQKRFPQYLFTCSKCRNDL